MLEKNCRFGFALSFKAGFVFDDEDDDEDDDEGDIRCATLTQ